MLTVSVETLVEGYERALTRFKESISVEGSPEETYIPLFEALNWAVILDVRLGYPDVPLAKGLRFARSLVHHQWAEMLEPRDERPASIQTSLASGYTGSGGLVRDWYWLPLEQLQEPEKSKRNPHYEEQKAKYLELLANNAARAALDELLVQLRSFDSRNERRGA